MPKALKLGAQNPREQAFPYYTRVVKVFSFEFESTSLHQRTTWSTFEFESTSLHQRTAWSTFEFESTSLHGRTMWSITSFD
jgi:hypothetical protein